MLLHICKSSSQITISSLNQTVDAGELCKRGFGWVLTPRCNPRLLFAFFGISYQRHLFNRKTENAHSCFSFRGVCRILFLLSQLVKLKHQAMTLTIIYSDSGSRRRDHLCYRRGCDRQGSHNRGDPVKGWEYFLHHQLEVKTFGWRAFPQQGWDIHTQMFHPDERGEDGMCVCSTVL